MQITRAHKDPRRRQVLPVRLLRQRTQKQAEPQPPHVHARPQERVQRVRKILLDAGDALDPPQGQARNENLTCVHLFISIRALLAFEIGTSLKTLPYFIRRILF